MNSTYKDRLKFIGFLLIASAFLLRNTLFPDNSLYGHWFWIAILGAVMGVNTLLSKVYGTAGAETGSNFAYTLCGLTIGTAWDGCPSRLAEQGEPLTGDEGARKLLKAIPEQVGELAVGDPGILHDIDRPDALRDTLSS